MFSPHVSSYLLRQITPDKGKFSNHMTQYSNLGPLSSSCVSTKQCLNFAVAHLNLALVLGRVGRIAEAKTVLRQCADLDGTGLRDPRTHHTARVTCLFHLGRLAMEQGNLHEAVDVFLEAVQNRPHYYAPQVTVVFQ